MHLQTTETERSVSGLPTIAGICLSGLEKTHRIRSQVYHPPRHISECQQSSSGILEGLMLAGICSSSSEKPSHLGSHLLPTSTHLDAKGERNLVSISTIDSRRCISGGSPNTNSRETRRFPSARQDLVGLCIGPGPGNSSGVSIVAFLRRGKT